MSNPDITIGRSTDNDITIEDPTVSSHHATLMFLHPGYQLIDNDSTNGTFVDHRRIKVASLEDSNEIAFGSYQISFAELLSTATPIYNRQKTDFSSEYVSLLHVFKQYQSKKDKIQTQSKGPLIFRLLASGSLVLLILRFPDLISDTIRFPLILLIGLLPIVYNLLFNQRKKKQELIALLDLEYEERLQCPKCGFRMIGYNYTYWQGRASCLNKKCTAKYRK